jgi:hypothetical protein
LSNVHASAFNRIAQQVHPRFVACGFIFLHCTRKLFFLRDAHEDGSANFPGELCCKKSNLILFWRGSVVKVSQASMMVSSNRGE